MGGRTKVYDEAQESASELRAALRVEFLRDGRIDEREGKLLSLADRVCAHTSAVATWVRVAIRWLGGGLIDHSLMADLRDADKARPAWGEPAGLEVERESEAA